MLPAYKNQHENSCHDQSYQEPCPLMLLIFWDSFKASFSRNEITNFRNT